MSNRRPPELDMTPDGQFVKAPRPPFPSRVLLWAVIVAVVAGAVTIAAFVLWLAFLMLPIAVGAALVAYGVYRFQAWRARQSISSQRNVWRP